MEATATASPLPPPSLSSLTRLSIPPPSLARSPPSIPLQFADSFSSPLSPSLLPLFPQALSVLQKQGLHVWNSNYRNEACRRFKTDNSSTPSHYKPVCISSLSILASSWTAVGCFSSQWQRDAQPLRQPRIQTDKAPPRRCCPRFAIPVPALPRCLPPSLPSSLSPWLPGPLL